MTFTQPYGSPSDRQMRYMCDGENFYKTVTELDEHRITHDHNWYLFHKNRFTNAEYYFVHGGQHSIEVWKK